jgi:tetratricopeptide (TPR) repeat protein
LTEKPSDRNAEPLPHALGRYRVVRRLGAGGMAEVFLAKQTGAEGLEKLLVVKRVLPSFARSVKFRAMFVDEAKVAMRLNHPNIVQVYAFEQVRDEFLLAMEFVDGLDLGRLVSATRRAGRRLPHGLVAWVVAEAARGLDYAHNRKDEHGKPLDIVHRDVSPQNVLLSYEGAVKIADFGIARARMVHEETGVIKGKFSYMSPEQARGKKVDRRSDVYSLGIMLAELLMGRAMFPGEQGLDVLDKVRQGQRTLPREVDPRVPEALDRIVRDATAYDPEERPQSARALATRLSAFLHGLDEVWDATALEQHIAEVAPRETTSPEVRGGALGGPGAGPGAGLGGGGAAVGAGPHAAGAPGPAGAGAPPLTALTVAAGLGGAGERGERELRERRHVIVVSGAVLAAEGTQVSAERGRARAVALDDALTQLLEQIAFKSDAVVRWPDPGDRSRFRLLLGLGRVTVHDALRAVRLAIDVSETIAGASEDRLHPVVCALGISRGVFSVVRGSADGRVLREEPVGEVLALADALAARADGDQVLAAGEIFRAARREFAFDEREPREVVVTAEGGPLAVRAYRVTGVRARDAHDARREAGGDAPRSAGDPGAPAAEGTDSGVVSNVIPPGGDGSHLVGRKDELRAIAEAYQESVTARRSVMMALVGDLGVGKSALCGAAFARLDPPARLLSVECAFGLDEVPFAVVADLVRAACRIPADAPADAARAQLREALGELLPREEDRAAAVAGLEPLFAAAKARGDDGADDRGEERAEDRSRALVRALRLVLGALGARGPLVVHLAAMQWIDPRSLEVVSALVRRTYPIPLLVLLSTRPDARVEGALGAVPRLELGELDKDERLALVRARFQGAAVPPDVMAAIVERAGGNPFFLIELVDALLERGVVVVEGEGEARRVVRRPGPIALPTTLEGAIAARLSELPADAKTALRWLAAAGGGLAAAELGSIAGRDLGAALAALETRKLVEQRGGAYVFASAVVRHVAYESIDPEDRRRMHRRIGAHLAALHAVPPARIARHLERAGDPAGAADAYLAAADAARDAYAGQDALRLYGKALALLPPDALARFRAHDAREQLLRALGRRVERRVELEAMRALADRSGDPRLRSRAYGRLARYELEEGRSAGVEALLRRALDAAIDAGDQAGEVEALRLSSQLARDLGDLPRALDACDRALLRAGFDTPLLAARGDVLVLRGMLLRRLGRVDESVDTLAEAVAIFRRTGHRREEANALNALAVTLLAEGAFEDSIVLLRASIAIDREIGDLFQVAKKLSNVGQLYAELGDTERALSFLRRAEDVHAALDDRTDRADALVGLAQVLAEQVGDLDAAGAALDRARRLAEGSGDRYDLAQERLVRIIIDAARGRWADALRHADEAIDDARASGMVGFELLALAEKARALAELGRSDEARAHAGLARAGLARTERVERAERVHYVLHLALARAGDPAASEEALRHARAVVAERRRAIRDATLRAHYAALPLVRAIGA